MEPSPILIATRLTALGCAFILLLISVRLAVKHDFINAWGASLGSALIAFILLLASMLEK